MEMTKNEVVLFGCGNFGRVHAKELSNLGVLNAIVDVDSSKEKIAKELHAGFYRMDPTKYVFTSKYFRSMCFPTQKSLEEYFQEIQKNVKFYKKCMEIERKEPTKDYENTMFALEEEIQYFKEAKKFKKEWKKRKIKEDFPEKLLNSPVWVIATSSGNHYSIAFLGLEKGKNVKKIFIEKPPTENLKELESLIFSPYFKDKIVGVDYIEMAHPVVKATKDNLDFEPYYYMNRRSKNLRGIIERDIGGGEGSRIILDDLVHDLSETLYFRGSLDDAKVTEAEIERWNEIEGGKYPYNTDVRARFKLKFPEAEAEILGGFADPEVRQYLVIDEKFKEAIYGNTLTRSHISPIAARINGKRNVEYMMDCVRNGKILTEEDQQKVLQRVGAETLEEDMKKYVPKSKWKDGKPMYGWAPLCNMLNNLLKAESNEELICPLSKVYDIQRISEEVYKVAEKEDAMMIKRREKV